MGGYKETVLQEASRILDYILKENLADEDQERIISYETIDTILARLDETLAEVAEEFSEK